MIDVLRFVVGLAADVVRRRAGRVAESGLLRQRLIAAQRTIAGQVRWAPWQRFTMGLTVRLAPAWRDAMLLVQPATILRWHRAGVRAFWRRRFRPSGRPPYGASGTHPRAGREQSALGGRASSKDTPRSEPTITLPRSVVDVIAHHVTWELESIDRMCLNLYVPGLQSEGGVVYCASDVAVARRVRASANTVGCWRKRFVAKGIDGLFDEPRPGAPRTINDAAVEQVVVATLERTPKGATHWSTRAMAKHQGLSHTTVGRIWRAFGLQRCSRIGARRSRSRATRGSSRRSATLSAST